jgi:hypothetical protein
MRRTESGGEENSFMSDGTTGPGVPVRRTGLLTTGATMSNVASWKVACRAAGELGVLRQQLCDGIGP